MRKIYLTVSLTLLFLLVGSPLFGQNEVRFRLSLVEEEVQAGQDLRAVLTAQVGPGWHLYSMTRYPAGVPAPQPTRITIVENPIFSLAGEITQPPPKVSFDENFGINTEYYEGTVNFDIPVRVAASTVPGHHPLDVKIRFMACNDRVCLPPQTENLTAQVRILTAEAGQSTEPPREAQTSPAPAKTIPSPAPAQAATAQSVTEPAEPAPAKTQEAGSDTESAQESIAPAKGNRDDIPTGTLAYIWFAMAMGGLALLTPCVFPMIPITVSYFTKREVSRSRAVTDAALYSGGIILTFTLLGFLLTFLLGAGGINRLAASPVVNILIATLFIVFALSLFGVFEIRLPSSWLSAVDKKSSAAGGKLGILLMALAFSLTSFTCTGPFVGTVMVAASQGDWIWSLLGMTAFATIFSSPFFVLALFPSWLKSLPKSGNWMNSIKITMGFLELAAALKFISNVDLVFQWELITRPVFITIWLAIALVTSIYLLGKFHFPHETPTAALTAGRVLAATTFLALSFYLLRGLFGFPLGELDAFLPPRDYGPSASLAIAGSGNETREAEWHSDYAAALQLSRSTGTPILIDFTGYTCTNCRWMEANIFVRPEVRKLFDRFVLVRLYTDGSKPEHESNLEMERQRFGTIALPLYAVMSPADEIVSQFPGLTRDPEVFIRFLREGLEGGGQLADLQSEGR